VIDCLNLWSSEQLSITVLLSKENLFAIEIGGTKYANELIESIANRKDGTHYFFKILVALSQNLNIATANKQWSFAKGELLSTRDEKSQGSAIRLTFKLDESIFTDTNIDYEILRQKLFDLSLLNKSNRITIKDTRTEYLNQNSYCYEQGIFYLMDMAIILAWNKPSTDIRYEGTIGKNHYQIGIANGAYWFSTKAMTYAGNESTLGHGSHLEGVVDGVIEAMKRYAGENNYTLRKIKREAVLYELLIVCSVKGDDVSYAGSTKEKVESAIIREQVKNIVSTLVYERANMKALITDFRKYE
jgi:DNA gyrase/topoisomerase IV subunit B